MNKLLLVAVALLFISGCAGKFEYIPTSKTYNIDNFKIIDKPKAAVWKEIIPSLGQSFFVINNIDADSGLINISYSGDPENYLDCGIINSYVKNARGERTYRFPASKGYQQYETFHKGQNLIFIERKMDLDGRINLIVQDISDNKTKITANVRYLVTKNIDAADTQGRTKHWNDSISFNSGGSAAFPGQQLTTCYPTGRLEQEILNMVE